jgi:hypothetical protein
MLVSWFWSGDTLRNRSVSDIVLCGTLDVPEAPLSLRMDWQRETTENLALEPGDVEVMPFARTRVRWPDYTRCVEAVAGWLSSLGLSGMPGACDVALMACRGARYHHDAAQYGGAAFCNLFLSEDKGLDLHFPALKLRIPLTRGTVVIFDTAQPHGVIQRGAGGFDANDFAPEQDCVQIFLSWELPIDNAQLSGALGIAFDPLPSATSFSPPPDDEQVWLDGAPAALDADSGQWHQVGQNTDPV